MDDTWETLADSECAFGDLDESVATKRDGAVVSSFLVSFGRERCVQSVTEIIQEEARCGRAGDG